MTNEILRDIILNFSQDKFIKFFREKSNKLSFPDKPFDYEDTENNFTEGRKLAEGKLDDGELIVCSFLVKKELTERSGKKAQYNLGKKILKEQQADAGIFIFYTTQGNFRFSLIYTNYLGKQRDWSNFKRFTYFVSPELTNKTFLRQIGESDFSTLEKIRQAFSVEPVTKQFYSEIQGWFFWAMDKVEFPDDYDKNREIRNAKNLIRLITRIVFVWFMKVKKLIPETLFDENFMNNILNYKDKTSSTYYKAILQNLFFATLNTQMKKDDPKSRSFIDEAKKKDYISDGYLQQGYYRYKRFIKNPNLFLDQFKNIPFLNGGLFDCLDKRTGSEEVRIDCFSDNPKNESRLKIPDELFFLEKETNVDLGKYLDPESKNRVIKKVRGLIPILQGYNFTIDENTPVDEEVALDPELLGKVFENLLASYNPETKTTARKSTGSYYTPREIVEYMVDESLIAYLKTALSNNTKNYEDKLHSLLDYNIEINPFENEKETTKEIIDAIEGIKILDPACGSGAFLMGVLHKLVLILHKLDPENKYWHELQYQKAIKETEEAFKVGDKEDRGERLKEINEAFDTNINDPNYARKLFLIRNCIYGVDIQEIAVQISKLRFFISLLIDQQTNDIKPNRGIKALPNLETKFVAANTLIGLGKLPEELFDTEVSKIIKELFIVREDFFYANSRWKKKELERKEEKLKGSLVPSIQRSLQKINEKKIQRLKIEIERLDKELNNLMNEPDKIEKIEILNLFGEKEIKIINKTQEKRRETKSKIFISKSELEKLKNPGKEPSVEIAQKISDFNPYDQNKSNSWFDPEWMFGVKEGFDVVIGNPPYIRQEEIKDQKPFLQRAGYEVYNSTSDIYTYFYEKGWQVLKQDGVLCFISSNKWMRARYGEKLRRFFKDKTALKQIIDFNGYKVFEQTVDTNIILFQKTEPSGNVINTLNIQLDFDKDTDISNYFQGRNLKIKQSALDTRCFTLANDVVINLKQKIEKIGVPLKDWDVKIYRGVTTGLNEVFIIDTATKEKLCKEDPKSAEILKPILRGRDIGRYHYKWAGLWVIATFPSLRLDIKRYPAVKDYLKTFGKRLEQTGKPGCRKKTDHEWFETQDNTAFYTEFEKDKIVWQLIVQEPSFVYDTEKYYFLDTGFIMTGNNLKYLIALLNSQPVYFFFRKFYAGNILGEKGFKYSKFYLAQLPIPKISDDKRKPFIALVDKILSITKDDDYLTKSATQAKVRELERQIDQLVYKLYGLTEEEIKIVEGV